MNLENRLEFYLHERKNNHIYRQLHSTNHLIDFTSNDYLGIAKSAWIKQQVNIEFNTHYKYHKIGATGSRLLSGNCALYEQLEDTIAQHHHAESALIFNSGYNANVGLISTVIRKDDLIFYDELVHASIHQGIKLSGATAVSFKHNDIDDLESKLISCNHEAIKFIITESLFSMDGDIAPLLDISNISKKYNCNFIIDEAHATGIFGEKGSGLCNQFGIEKDCFARVYTYGKAMGTHGASVVGSLLLKNYLINYAKPFIYSTALNIYDLLTIQFAYQYISLFDYQKNKLFNNINYFNSILNANNKSQSPIFSFAIDGADACRNKAKELYKNGIDAKAIVYPTVPKGKERLRIIVHSYNTFDELNQLNSLLY